MTENKVFKKNIKAEAGRSMVEMLGVLAIIGVLSVGGISGYSKAMAKYKASKAMDQLSLLIANIRTAFATVSSYGDLNNQTAAQYSIVSRDMYANGLSGVTSNGGGLVNAFGGSLILGSYPYNDIAGAGFAIVYNGLNTEACVQLATADWGTGGLAFVHIKGSAGSLPATTPTADETNIFDVGDMPIALSKAYTACGATNDSKKSITWYFY